MNLTPVRVGVGKERSVVDFAAANGKPFQVSMDTDEAKWFLDHLDEPLKVSFHVIHTPDDKEGK